MPCWTPRKKVIKVIKTSILGEFKCKKKGLFGEPLWGSKCQGIEGDMKIRGKNETEEDKMPRHEKYPPFRWVSIGGIFTVRLEIFLESFDANVPTRRC